MDELPYDEVIPIKMSELRIKVSIKSILTKIRLDLCNSCQIHCDVQELYLIITKECVLTRDTIP